MAYQLHCPSCTAVNNRLSSTCEFCGMKLNKDNAWKMFKSESTPYIKRLDTSLNNYSSIDYILGLTLAFGGPALVIFLSFNTVFESIIGALIAGAISFIPFFLAAGAVFDQAENRKFKKTVRTKLDEFQQENALTVTELTRLVKEVCGTESSLFAKMEEDVS